MERTLTEQLIQAVENGDLQTLNNFIAKDVNLDIRFSYSGLLDPWKKVKNSTLLRCNHSLWEEERWLHLLINQGLHIDAQNSQGHTPLIFATHQKNTNLMKILLENEANRELGSRGKSALFFAVERGSEEAVSLLLLFKAEVQLRQHCK